MSEPVTTDPTRAEALGALLERVTKATGADRKIDAEIVAALRYCRPGFPDWIVGWAGPFVPNIPDAGRVAIGHSNGKTGTHWSAEPVTASLDAALAMAERVMPPLDWTVRRNADKGFHAILDGPTPETPDGSIRPWVFVSATAPTPALALLAALLKSLAQELGQ